MNFSSASELNSLYFKSFIAKLAKNMVVKNNAKRGGGKFYFRKGQNSRRGNAKLKGGGERALHTMAF